MLKTTITLPISLSSEIENFTDSSFSKIIIAWQKRYGRHTLPWQNTRDAYHIWLSEIMLQQTQVKRVILYYKKFLKSFPNIQSLAEAPIDNILAHWSGLGYYARAHNLHRCAKQVVINYHGFFPDIPELLINLPGIGRSTAAAIVVFAYNKHAAILDSNVKRVFTRVFGIDGFPGYKQVEKSLWRRAIALLPKKNIKSYTQGLMDLGAILCMRNNPICTDCPLKLRCIALNTNRINELPTRVIKKTIPSKKIIMLVINYNAVVLLEQRPNHGIWSGLLSLPEIVIGSHTAEKLFAKLINLTVKPFGNIITCYKLPPFLHVFTHFKLQILPYKIILSNCNNISSTLHYIWYSISYIENAPLPSPIKKLLLKIFNI